MADIKQFFITKLPELLPCEEGIPPVIGSLTLAASFHDDNGKADASQYYLHDRAGKTSRIFQF